MSAHTILIMAGGTGGHIMPGLAVAEVLRGLGWRVVWLGAPRSMEAELVPKQGYEMAWVDFSGVRGKGFMRWLALPLDLLHALGQSTAAILRHRPDVVLGMGGYITFPGGLMAALLLRPLVIHEQNSLAGLSNRVLALFARRVLSGFPAVMRRAEWLGNPVRAEIAALPPPEQRYVQRSGALRLLVVGGSLGAQALNEVLPQALLLIEERERPLVLHQSGSKHLASLEQRYARAGVCAELRAFIDDMAAAYAAADVVICRAGALTVAELAAAGVASILVPFPHAVDDHQTHNARFLSTHGAAILLPQQELSAERLATLLRGLTREKLLAMARQARALAKPDAAKQVALACAELAE